MLNLVNIISEEIEERDKKRTEEYQQTGHSFWNLSGCTRSKYYAWNKEPKTNPPDASAIFKMTTGSLLEEYMTEALDDAQIKYDYELLGKTKREKYIDGYKLPFRYELDNRIFYNGKVYVVEMKTAYGKGIKWIVDNGMPKDEHIFQVMAYMKMENLFDAFIIYLGRDNGYRTGFRIQARDGKLFLYQSHKAQDGKVFDSEKDISKYIAEFKTHMEGLKDFEKALEEKKTPPRGFTASIVDGEFKEFTSKGEQYKGDWNCDYCSWRDKCWKNILEKSGKYYGEKCIVEGK